jgi:drug/metabolite transporter (DMT)-like permease
VWLLFVLMAIVPQFLGHTVFNYLLAEVPASVVAIAVTGEPVGATLLAFAFFGEVPRWTAFVGGAVILAGIYVTISAQARRAAQVAPIE